MNSLALALRNAWNTNLAGLFSTAVTMTQTSLTDLTSNTGLQAVNTTSAAGSFVSTTQMPANVALVISLKIGRRYRGGHPRMYLTGQCQVNTVNNQNWTGTWLTTVGTQTAAWLTAVNALTYASMPTITLVNLSYYTGGVLRGTPAWDNITSIATHTRVDTQRRRLGKEIA